MLFVSVWPLYLVYPVLGDVVPCGMAMSQRDLISLELRITLVALQGFHLGAYACGAGRLTGSYV